MSVSLEVRISNISSEVYANRLRREGRSPLAFLRHDGVPHHSSAGVQAMRISAIMLKMFYGSRSERGLRTAEIRDTMFETCEKCGIDPLTGSSRATCGAVQRRFRCRNESWFPHDAKKLHQRRVRRRPVAKKYDTPTSTP